MVWHRGQLEDAVLNLFGRLLVGNWIKSTESERSVNLKCLLEIDWNV
jgi:hypothetical protein